MVPGDGSKVLAWLGKVMISTTKPQRVVQPANGFEESRIGNSNHYCAVPSAPCVTRQRWCSLASSTVHQVGERIEATATSHGSRQLRMNKQEL